MGTAERKEREKQQRKLNIVDSAEKLFFEKGFEFTTMDDIAKEVELSKGTLYLYFKSKDELIAEIVKRGEHILANLFVEAVNNNNNGLCKVKNIGEAYIKFYKEYSDYYQIFMLHHEKLHKTKGECDSEHESQRVFIKAIEIGISDGSIRNDIEPNKTALLLWAQLMGVLLFIQQKSDVIENVCNSTSEELIKNYFEFAYIALKT